MIFHSARGSCLNFSHFRRIDRVVCSNFSQGTSCKDGLLRLNRCLLKGAFVDAKFSFVCNFMIFSSACKKCSFGHAKVQSIKSV